MKKIVILITILLTSLTIQAQTKFIEIEVNDTILLKPISFKVTITIEEDMAAGMDYSDDENEESNQLKRDSYKKNKAAEIENLLTSNNFKFSNSISNDNFLGIPKNNKNLGFTVNLSSVAELKSLEAKLKTIDKIETNIFETIYEDSSKYDEILYKRILSKAKIKANIITSNSGLTLGVIYEIRDNHLGLNVQNPMEDYTKLITNMMSKFQSGLNSDRKEYKKSYIFKYEVK
jgi:hypothetical protein